MSKIGRITCFTASHVPTTYIVHEFLLLYSSKSLLTTTTMSIAHGMKTIGVLGAGQMGLGIAYVAAVRAGVSVLLYDRSKDQMAKGMKLMDKLLEKEVNKGKIESSVAKEARDRVTLIDHASDGIREMRDVDMCVEAASENFALKAKLFANMAKELRPNAILASNTSSISITKIAAASIPEGETAASEAGKASASRVVGLHFFNPVPVMPLVELISGLQTSEETLGRARAFAIACGKEVTVSKDVPGFVSNALLMPFLNEVSLRAYSTDSFGSSMSGHR
ncbi:hypothetical protein FRB94_003639 [Tulasnella sp. JGI-2019a]|nr:hypothetical protein FRB94_003639 [Tulasnella sp. JGI-2019a]